MYNVRTTLGDILDNAILSALNQDYLNIEVLVVDDSSSDDDVGYIRKRAGDFKSYRA